MDKHLKIAFYGLTTAIMLACATGGGESGTGFSQLVHGTITRFGSIYVNGVKYNTDAATYSIEGASGDESQLAQGMVVTFTANLDAGGTTGTAGHISFADQMEGIVTSNTLATGGTLTVMNRAITPTADLVFDADGSLLTLDTLNAGANGSLVEISGYPAANNGIIATRIKVVKAIYTTGDKVEVKGTIASLGTNTFSLDGLTVVFSDATARDLTLADDAYVEVSSEGVAAFNGSNQFVATRIERRTDPRKELAESGKEIEIEGVVTNTTPGAGYEFELNGQAIHTTPQTTGTPALISLDMKLEVSGYFNSDGILVADEIEQRIESEIRIAAYIDTNGVLIAENAIEVMGQIFYLDNLSIMEDDSAADLKRLSVSDLAAAQRIELRGYYDSGTNKTMLTYLKRDDDEGDNLLIEGRVTAIDGSGIPRAVEGIAIDISNTPTPGFTATVGDFVKVKGPATGYDGTKLIASEVSN